MQLFPRASQHEPGGTLGLSLATQPVQSQFNPVKSQCYQSQTKTIMAGENYLQSKHSEDIRLAPNRIKSSGVATSRAAEFIGETLIYALSGSIEVSWREDVAIGRPPAFMTTSENPQILCKLPEKYKNISFSPHSASHGDGAIDKLALGSMRHRFDDIEVDADEFELRRQDEAFHVEPPGF